jgi:DNA transposition AAA+ family ATPase
MKKEAVQIGNFLRGYALVEQLCEGAASGSDLRLGLFSGVPGMGKTFTATEIAKRYGGVIFVRAQRIWDTAGSARPLVLGLNEAIKGHSFGASLQSAYQNLLIELRSGKISLIIIDEADYLAGRVRTYNCPVLDVCRDLADQSGVPFLFISVHNLAHRLTNPSPFLETISSRLAGHAEFKRLSLSDAVKLAALVEDVHLDKGLIGVLLRMARGSIRPLLGLYSQLEIAATKAGVDGDLDLARVQKFGLLRLLDGVTATDTGIADEATDNSRLRAVS